MFYLGYTAPCWIAAATVGVLLWRRPESPLGPLTRWRAIGLAAAGWLVLFGWATVNAVRDLVSPFLPAIALSGWAVWRSVLTDSLPSTTFAALMFIAVHRTLASRSPGSASPDSAPAAARPAALRPVLLWVEAFLAVFTAAVLGFVLAVVPGWDRHPWDTPGLSGHHPWILVSGLFTAAAAAVTEELIVVAVPVLLLRAAGVRTRTIVIVAIAARLAYHLYYGWVTLGLIVWAATALAIYLRLGLLWPLIAEHLVFDACGALDQAGYVTAGIALRLAVWFALVLGIAATYLRGHRHRQRMLAAAITSGAQQRWEQVLGELTGRPEVTLSTRRWQTEPATTRLDPRHHTYQLRVGVGMAELTPDGQKAALAVWKRGMRRRTDTERQAHEGMRTQWLTRTGPRVGGHQTLHAAAVEFRPSPLR